VKRSQLLKAHYENQNPLQLRQLNVLWTHYVKKN